MKLSTRSLSLCGAAALLALVATTGRATAQVQAFYPLMTDLLDATNTYGPMTLAGTPPPAPPSNGVCVNGIYHYNTGGQDVRTPLLPSLDTTDFQVDVEFNITALPAVQGPVLIGGNGWRFLGIYLQGNGTVGVKYNNSNLTWSSTTLSTGIWYVASLRYEANTVQLLINNSIVHQAVVGPLNDGNNKNFTTNDYSVGSNFNGCIRNLMISNDTTTGVATASVFGTGCGGSGGAPALAPNNTPQLGSTFTVAMSNLPAVSPVAFMTVGFSSTQSILGPLPYNLQPLGFGASCDLLVSTDATVVFQTPQGSGTFGLAVPTDPAFSGLELFFQGAAIDPSATGGFTFTNAVDATIGT
ncbi:MAG: hypothetical protein H6838_12600 [Planctomycetes bacterium]|nr:hypothetical protein [Planctomycetota bacterium]MCB9886326.1 hypothetical protein [Planctomycetota bacterium]